MKTILQLITPPTDASQASSTGFAKDTSAANVGPIMSRALVPPPQPQTQDILPLP
jgi:hypothetical protein